MSFYLREWHIVLLSVECVYFSEVIRAKDGEELGERKWAFLELEINWNFNKIVDFEGF